MRKVFLSFVCLLAVSVSVFAQDIVYSSLKDFMAFDGDTVYTLNIEKRNKNQILLMGGADYRISSEGDESLSHWLRKRCFAVRSSDGSLYLNCRKLRYKKLRFGMWFAPAICVNQHIFFCAAPLGSMIGENFVETDDVKLGGRIGDALASSSLVHKRVCYQLDTATSKITFLGKQEMLKLLSSHPELQEAYLNEGGQEAIHTFKYLQILQSIEK